MTKIDIEKQTIYARYSHCFLRFPGGSGYILSDKNRHLSCFCKLVGEFYRSYCSTETIRTPHLSVSTFRGNNLQEYSSIERQNYFTKID